MRFKLFSVFITLLFSLIQITNNFQFRYLDVSADSYLINTRTSYTFYADRTIDKDLFKTSWDSQQVPTNSLVTITFPNQYTLSSLSCDAILLSTLGSTTFPTGYSCNVTGQNLVISGLFTTGLYVTSLTIQVSNILNPSPAITTDNFVIKIGNDYSQNTSSAAVTLMPTKFKTLSATFDPKTVNTTGNLILKFSSLNTFDITSNIVVEFPSSLTWTREISPTHFIPLNGSLTCGGITTNIKNSITCSSLTSTREVTLSTISDTNNPAQTIISLKIGPLFSPPSIQQIDSIKVKIKKLYSDAYVDQDSDSVIITGLTAKSMTVAVNPLSTMIVNSKIGLQFDITLPDTINQNDVFRITFPSSVTSFSYTFATSSSGFTLNTPLTYDSINKILEIKQKTTTIQTNFANKVISISVLTFTAPPSIKPFGITVQLLRNSNLMAQGIASTNAVVNSYTGTISSSDMKINHSSNYTITIDTKDNHTNLMMIEIIIPSTLTINVSTFSAKTSISSTPTYAISASSTGNITLTKITSSSSTIIAQSLVITFMNIINPSSVKSIGSFSIKTYYNEDYTEKVSLSTINSLLTTVNGQITQSTVKITPTSFINYQVTPYTIELVIQNFIQLNGYMIIKFPSEIDLTLLTSIKINTNQSISTQQNIQFVVTISDNSIKIINNVSLINSNQKITLYLSNLRNPSSTKPTTAKAFQMQSYNSLSQTIDILNVNNALSVQTQTVNSFGKLLMQRTSLKNDQLGNYSCEITQTQKFQTGLTFILVIDHSVIQPSSLNCVDSNNQNNVTCSFITKPLSLSTLVTKTDVFLISVSLPSTYIGLNVFTFKILNLQNSPSFSPFSIQVFSTSSTLLYLYSAISQSYQNSELSSVLIPSYAFSKRQLAQKTQLSVKYQVNSNFNILNLEFQTTQFIIDSILCTSIDFSDLLCTIVDNNTLKFTSFTSSTYPKTATLLIQNLVTPNKTNIAPLYLKLYSFDLNNYQMGSNTNQISYDLQCAFPCKTCSPTNSSSCLSCYQSPLSVKQYLGDDFLCYQQCPDGYNQNIDTYTCQKCQSPCLYCNNIKTNCTKCNQSSQFIYLLYTPLIDLNTCIKTCPNQYFADTNFLPVYCKNCQLPCLTCNSSNFCLGCSDSAQVLYNGKCLASCPVDVTVFNSSDKTCIPCSSQCKTCQNISTNCTSCSNISIFYQGKCWVTCPNNLLKYNSTCVSCDQKCLTCQLSPTNCTSCVKNSTIPYFFQFDCFSSCPNFYYPNASNICVQCSKLNIGCKNCSDQTTCSSCDSGYALLGKNCLDTLPQGYINISGVAVPCSGDCKSCQGTVQNCTSCKTLNLNGNLCQLTCDYGQTPVSQVCQTCQYPCLTCSIQVYLCNSCYSNSSTFLYLNSCLGTCPDKFFNNQTSSTCSPCVTPCEKCTSQSVCLTCLNGFNFNSNTSQCLTTCPQGMVGQNKLCVLCQSPCLTCSTTKKTCITCIQNYFYSQTTKQCLLQCPSGTIKNESLRICSQCQSPCLNCQNQTTTCLNCISTSTLYQNSCLSQCPSTFYSVSSKCVSCVSPCLTCTSSVLCSSCTGSLYMYKQSCVVTCPDSSAKILNGTCTQCDSGCYSCQSSGVCNTCYPGYIFFNDLCYIDCPTGYIVSKVNNTSTCVVKQESDVKLQQTLTSTSSSLFPLPFTIFGLIIIGAGLISKLQNQTTYLIGFAYSIFGLLQSLSVIYLLYSYYFNYQYDILTVYLFLIGLGIFVFLNMLGLFVHSFQLLSDKKFQQWMKKNQCSSSTTFWITGIFSFAINYKFKMILFSKIFNFSVFKAELISVQKFKVFNAFSFLGIIGEALLLYTIFKQILTKTDLGSSLFLIFIDALIILALNVVFSIASSWKTQDFFSEEVQGMIINKKITIDGDFINKKPLKDHEQFYPYYETRKTGDQSHEGFKLHSSIINQYPDEYTISVSEQVVSSDKNSKNVKTKDKLYFQDEDLSSQTLRYKNQLDQIPQSLKQNQNNKVKQHIFQKHHGEQADQHKQNQNQNYQFSQNFSQLQRKSEKKSENIFCESPRKKQIQNNQKKMKKTQFSEFEQKCKIKKTSKTGEIQSSASQYNKVMKQKQMKQILKDDSTKKKNFSKKSRQSENSNSKLINNLHDQKEYNNILEPQIIENLQTKQKSVALIILKNNADVEIQAQIQENKQNHNFQQIQNDLIMQQEIGEESSGFDHPKSRKLKINSLNSSKTDIIVTKNVQKNPNNQICVDSDSQTIHQQGKLKPQKKQRSLKSLQNSIKRNIHYQGQQRQIQQVNVPKRIKKAKYFKKQSGETQKYDFQQNFNQFDQPQYVQIQISHTELASSQLESLDQQIQKSPLGYSQQSRVMEFKQTSIKSQNDEVLLELNSQIKKPQKYLLPEQKKLQNSLNLHAKNKRNNNSFKKMNHHQLDDELADQSQSNQYRTLIQTINSSVNSRSKPKKLTKTSQNERINKRPTDIHMNMNFEQNQLPILPRKNSSKQRTYPIEQKRSIQKSKKRIQLFDSGQEQDQIYNSPSKRSQKFINKIQQTLTPIQQSHTAQRITPKIPKSTKIQNQSKSKPNIHKHHIQFDPIYERIHTNTIWNDQTKDQLDNLDFQRVDMIQNRQNRTNFTYQTIQKPTINYQGEDMRFNRFVSTQMLPRPDLRQYESLQKRRNFIDRQQKSFDNSSSFNNSRALSSYYSKHKREDSNSKKKNIKDTSNEKDKSRERQGKNIHSRAGSRAGQKRFQKSPSRNNEIQTSQIQSKRLKQLQKIYLQRLH